MHFFKKGAQSLRKKAFVSFTKMNTKKIRYQKTKSGCVYTIFMYTKNNHKFSIISFLLLKKHIPPLFFLGDYKKILKINKITKIFKSAQKKEILFAVLVLFLNFALLVFCLSGDTNFVLKQKEFLFDTFFVFGEKQNPL